MNYKYSAERNVQMVLYLLKAYNIKRVIASPGATNISIVASMQQDPYFEMYSCVDERSAAYMAVGMADETGEPVVLTCTGATSARNYMPALTEAYYRKLPVIAITSTQDESLIGHLIAQVTDRSQQPKDLVVESVHIQNIRSANDEWDCTIKLNRALQAYRLTPGPIHINLSTGMGGGYDVAELPNTMVIRMYQEYDQLPSIHANGNVAVFVGSHPMFSQSEISAIETFCETNNAVVFCDHTSSYKGKYRIQHSLIGAQDNCRYDLSKVDLLIHIGEISGDYDTLRYVHPKRVWRVNPDGHFRDTFHACLDSVFAMEEKVFFQHYSDTSKLVEPTYYATCKAVYDNLIEKIGELPLSNIYIAKRLSSVLPENSVLYLGILNTLRSWNYFEVPESVRTVSNVGGFGIDGIMSSLVGTSMCRQDKPCFGILGDLSFFYDMNSIGNRNISNNLRILVINNGHGQDFQMYNHSGAFLGEDVNKYVAAGGHYSAKSKELIKHYAEDLGFRYMKAETKDEFDDQYKEFVTTTGCTQPVLFEVFTTNESENEALKVSRTIDMDVELVVKAKIKSILRRLLK